jgi:hypothetical protein|uniref:Uncharacterized protein n=1 Tax=Zea mays TaxID=4577 RepID=A0A804PIW4_MAIZE
MGKLQPEKQRAPARLIGHLPGICGEPDAAEGQVDGAKEPAVAVGVMPPQRREVLRHTPSSVARELAAHLEDAGGGRAPHRQRKEEDEEHREEAGSAGRRCHRSDRAMGLLSPEDTPESRQLAGVCVSVYPRSAMTPAEKEEKMRRPSEN